MVAPALGALIMRGGAAMAGSKSASSAAGSILGSGGKAGLDKLMSINVSMDKVWKTVKKIYEKLSEVSPMLKQTNEIFKKAWNVTLRPFGDFIGKFLRPLAVWYLKIAVKWYQWLSGVLGTGGGENDTRTGKDDLIKQKEAEKIGAEMRGDTVGMATADAEIKELKKTWWDSITKFFTETLPEVATNAWNGIVTFFTTTLPEAAATAWAFVTVFFTETLPKFFTEDLPYALGQFAATVVKFFTETIPKAAEDTWNAIVTFFTETLPKVAQDVWDSIVKFFTETLPKVAQDVWDSIVKFFTETLPTTLQAGWDAVKRFFTETIPGWFNTMIQKFKDIWNDIKGIWDKVKNIGGKIVDNVVAGFKGEEKITGPPPKKAVGGPVRETGLYNLHAGERIMTAGETARAKGKGAGSQSFNNYINITANLSNDMDVKSLARKLAEYQETELRRRVSYL
jgi:hypothetical protein